MDFSGFTDADLRDEIAAMEFALNAPGGKVFDDSEARLRQRLQAAKAELAKRDVPPSPSRALDDG
jgi:hypothetical protein